jgi:hypothetical protein
MLICAASTNIETAVVRKNMVIGMTIGLFFVIKANYHVPITLSKEGSHYQLCFNKDVSFFE